MINSLPHATKVLKPETVEILEQDLSSHQKQFVEGLAKSNPKELQQMERDGTLLERVEQDSQRFKAAAIASIQKQLQGGRAHPEQSHQRQLMSKEEAVKMFPPNGCLDNPDPRYDPSLMNNPDPGS